MWWPKYTIIPTYNNTDIYSNTDLFRAEVERKGMGKERKLLATSRAYTVSGGYTAYDLLITVQIHNGSNRPAQSQRRQSHSQLHHLPWKVRCWFRFLFCYINFPIMGCGATEATLFVCCYHPPHVLSQLNLFWALFLLIFSNYTLPFPELIVSAARAKQCNPKRFCPNCRRSRISRFARSLCTPHPP